MLSLDIWVVTPIDPPKGQSYVEPVHSEGKCDYIYHIYNITYIEDDYINPTANGKFSWWSIVSCIAYLDKALENLKNRIHKVSMRKSPRITKPVRRVGVEESDLPTYEVLPYLAPFLTKFQVKVTESKRLSTLDFVLKATPTRWWGTHK